MTNSITPAYSSGFSQNKTARYSAISLLPAARALNQSVPNAGFTSLASSADNSMRETLLNLYAQAVRMDPGTGIMDFLQSISKSCEDVMQGVKNLEMECKRPLPKPSELNIPAVTVTNPAKNRLIAPKILQPKPIALLKESPIEHPIQSVPSVPMEPYCFLINKQKTARLFGNKARYDELKPLFNEAVKKGILPHNKKVHCDFLNFLLDKCSQEYTAGRAKRLEKIPRFFEYSIQFGERPLTIFLLFDDQLDVIDIRLTKNGIEQNKNNKNHFPSKAEIEKQTLSPDGSPSNKALAIIEPTYLKAPNNMHQNTSQGGPVFCKPHLPETQRYQPYPIQSTLGGSQIHSDEERRMMHSNTQSLASNPYFEGSLELIQNMSSFTQNAFSDGVPNSVWLPQIPYFAQNAPTDIAASQDPTPVSTASGIYDFLSDL